MIPSGLSSGTEELLLAALVRFKQDGYTPAVLRREIADGLNWTPTCSINANGHVNTLVEVSEDKPYPQILRLRHAELSQYPEPISVYVVCPEEVALEPRAQEDIRALENHGFGLVLVNKQGKAHQRFAAIPIVQVISYSDYLAAAKSLPVKIKKLGAQAYVDYRAKPLSGVIALSEITEGLAVRAISDAVKKGWLTASDARGPVADVLDKLYATSQAKNARAAIGGIRNYIATFRNPNHHWPKNKKKAYEKYAQCRHAFLEGLRHLRDFPTAMKNIGLTGLLPPT